jgi:hypothetical protein
VKSSTKIGLAFFALLVGGVVAFLALRSRPLAFDSVADERHVSGLVISGASCDAAKRTFISASLDRIRDVYLPCLDSYNPTWADSLRLALGSRPLVACQKPEERGSYLDAAKYSSPHYSPDANVIALGWADPGVTKRTPDDLAGLVFHELLHAAGGGPHDGAESVIEGFPYPVQLTDSVYGCTAVCRQYHVDAHPAAGGAIDPDRIFATQEGCRACVLQTDSLDQRESQGLEERLVWCETFPPVGLALIVRNLALVREDAIRCFLAESGSAGGKREEQARSCSSLEQAIPLIQTVCGLGVRLERLAQEGDLATLDRCRSQFSAKAVALLREVAATKAPQVRLRPDHAAIEEFYAALGRRGMMVR